MSNDPRDPRALARAIGEYLRAFPPRPPFAACRPWLHDVEPADDADVDVVRELRARIEATTTAAELLAVAHVIGDVRLTKRESDELRRVYKRQRQAIAKVTR